MSSIPTNAAAVADADVAALFSSPSSQQQQSQQQQQQQPEGESSWVLHAEDRYRYDRFHSASVCCNVDEYYSQRLNNTAVVNINAGRYDTAIVSLYRALQLSKSALQQRQRQQNPCRRRATVPSSSSSSSSPIRCMCGSCTLDACIFHSENTPSIMNSNNNSNDDDNDESTMMMPNNTSRLSSSASSSALDSSISMANNNNSYTISNNDNDNDNSNNNNSNRNRRNKKKRDISNGISPSDSNSTRDTDDDDDGDESNNTMNTKKKRKTTNNNTGSDTAEERCHQRQQQYRQQQQSSSAISSNNSFSSTYCIYQQPIHIPHVGHAMGSTLFFIVSFNLALASQLKYIASSTSSSVSTTSITKTIALYELILKWHTTTNNSTPEDDVRSDWDGNTNHNVITNNISNASIRFEMMIYNNLSEIYRMYSDRHNRSNHRIGGLGGGNDDRYCGNTNTDVNNTNTKKKKKKKTHSDEKSNMYLERLLSRVMMIVEYKTRHPTHQTTDRQQQPQQQQLQWNSNGTTTTTTTYFDYGIRSNHTTTNNATTTTTTTPLSLIPSFGYYYYNVNIDRFLQNLCTNGRALMLHHQEEPDNKNNHDHTSNTNDVQRYANAA